MYYPFFRLFLAIILLFNIGALSSQAVASSNCSDNKNSLTCVKQQWQQADAALNQHYQQLMKKLPKATQRALRLSQRNWIRFRDAQCQRTTTKLADMQCLRTLTANRVKEWQNTYLQKPLPQAKTAPDYASADRQLNQTYRHIMGSLHKHDKKQLRTSQRLWLPFRDENCLAQQSYGVSQQQCLARMTVHRTQALQHYYQGNFHGLTAQSLIGEWRGLGGEAVMRLQFGISKGIHYYLSHLENLPFEAGQWQFNRGQLNIIASNGKLMHRYEKVALENGVLSLYEKDGALLQYQKQP